MSALPEYKTRELLATMDVPIVEGRFVAAGQEPPADLPEPTVFLKAQIPGATSRAASGLVRKCTTVEERDQGLAELLAPGSWGQAEGVLVAKGEALVGEYYAACMLDFGTYEQLPTGQLLFSAEGGSGVEGRSASLVKIPFSVLAAPTADEIAGKLGALDNAAAIGAFLANFAKTFLTYKLMVLEANPIGVRQDGSLVAIDCRAEFESQAVTKKTQHLFEHGGPAEKDLSPIEALVDRINAADPSGTGFFRQNRQPAPEGAWRVATNLCGGGGKMLWEMVTGARKDIYEMNESDTSGGLSAFKSYRILRAILSQKGAQALVLTGSGMAFQNQHHLATAVWKALRESPTPIPCLLRFGGTFEDQARALFEKTAKDLPVPVRAYPPEIFPNAMIDDIAEMAQMEVGEINPVLPPEGEPTFTWTTPPGEFFIDESKLQAGPAPACVTVCPTEFLTWDEAGKIGTKDGARCIGCLLCEQKSLLEGSGELRIRLTLPEED